MASSSDDSVWSKNMFKRLGKETTSSPSKVVSSSPDLPRSTPPASSLPPASFHEAKLGSTSYSRPVRGFQHWRPVFAIICALTTFALYRSFKYAHLWGSTSPTMTRGSEVWAKGMESLLDRGVTCDPRFATLKVYMYDLPSDFHFGMTSTFEPSLDPDNVWPRNLSNLPRYPGGLYQQHSPEYWLTADLLTSTMPDRKTECTAVRVFNPQVADIFFVPFFASLSYNKYTKMEHEGQDLNEQLQRQLVFFLTNQTWWQESGGKDHVIVIHHPNSLHWVRDQLSPAMYVVCDFGRYPEWMANIRKDIVAPYKHVVGTFKGDGANFGSRPLLLFFQGAIVRKEGGIIRQQLYELLKDEAGVHFATGNTQSNGIKSATTGMRSSKFCLHLAGDTPSSNRLFDAIVSHCVPVIISDEIELPYEDELDYSEFCLFVRGEDALKKDFVINLLRSVQAEEWTRMWKRLKTVALHFEYQHPTVPGDAVNMVWRAVARRIPSVKMALNKDKRYARSGWVKPAFVPPPVAAPNERPPVVAAIALKEQQKTNNDESTSLNQNSR
ncbi:hypothetical protein R1sor_002235 [Riccia sorocarpa]|uniref:Exostosin GT47 domain-containing protein n=1 Tax=Riccia sorocarpa TaxID=122646 RepID=A0ABD3GY77_9MARC